jgi:deazaflavin-dependent oxidoreductase (nitroreductase family)
VLQRHYRRRLDARTGPFELTRRGGFSWGFGAGTRRGSLGSAILTADRPTPAEGSAMEDELVASGRFVRIETRGERSGLDRPVTVGFVDDDGTPGAILVAATAPDAAWARNLLADATCHVRVGDRSFDAVAEPLAGADHARAIRGLILRYGTPAEGLGRGPSFRLRPVAEGAT